MSKQRFSVVFVNANDCAILRQVYRDAASALKRNNKDPGQLMITAGHNRGADYSVVAYGNGQLSLEEASSIVAQLRGESEVRDDIYWARKLTLQRVEGCPPPAL